MAGLAISFQRSLCSNFFFGELKREPKYVETEQVQGSLYSFFGGKQLSDDKAINTASETSALTKKTCKFQEAWKVKIQLAEF